MSARGVVTAKEDWTSISIALLDNIQREYFINSSVVR